METPHWLHLAPRIQTGLFSGPPTCYLSSDLLSASYSCPRYYFPPHLLLFRIDWSFIFLYLLMLIAQCLDIPIPPIIRPRTKVARLSAKSISSGNFDIPDAFFDPKYSSSHGSPFASGAMAARPSAYRSWRSGSSASAVLNRKKS